MAVAEHGTFSSAAKALHTVQSNISAHVARLEHELGTTLVDRGSGRLTQEGTAVVARARRIQAELDAIRSDVARLGTELTGDVRFGVIGTTARWLVAGLLDGLRVEHPRVRTVVVEASTTSLTLQLESGHLDLAVVNLPVDDLELATEPLFEEDLVLVAPADHPLARHDRVTLAQLGEHPLLLSAPGTALRDELELQAARGVYDFRRRPSSTACGSRRRSRSRGSAPRCSRQPRSPAGSRARGSESRSAGFTGVTSVSPGGVVARLTPQAQGVAELVRGVVRAQATDQPGLHLALPSAAAV